MKNKKTIALLGAEGFVGKNIAEAIISSDKYNFIPILRRDPAKKLISYADIVIHSANPAKRFNAENDPINDFQETIDKTASFFSFSKGKKFILISSISCRTQIYTTYGRHRRACEFMVSYDSNSLVIRLGPMFGGDRKQDMLHDILNGKEVFVSEDTLYSYVDVSWTGRKIIDLCEKECGTIEIGAKNYVRLGDIRDRFNSKSIFSGRNENQIPKNCYDGPDANDVYIYAQKEIMLIEKKNNY